MLSGNNQNRSNSLNIAVSADGVVAIQSCSFLAVEAAALRGILWSFSVGVAGGQRGTCPSVAKTQREAVPTAHKQD